MRAITSGQQPEGKGAPPIVFDEDQLRQAHVALAIRQSYAVEQRAFSTVDSLLPPWLSPVIVGPQHENRLLGRLPVVPADGLSVEFIRHTSTTGAAAITAEGALKPEVTLVTDKVILPMVKIAAHTGISWKSLS